MSILDSTAVEYRYIRLWSSGIKVIVFLRAFSARHPRVWWGFRETAAGARG